MAHYSIRPIAVPDSPKIKSIIETVMPEFGAKGPGFAIEDAEVQDMHAAYQMPRHAYFVVEMDGEVRGGGGIAPLAGVGEDTCELRKMYFLPELRGLGAGEAMILRCLARAKSFGYRCCYLETLHGMQRAQRLYERIGFGRIEGPMGNTGHFGCNRFYLLNLDGWGENGRAPK